MSLDMLRGYAALSVVIAHTTIAGLYNVEPFWSYLKWTPLRLIWGGHQAVILFFVLSGFALSHMWETWQNKSYGRYVVARAARLYIPYTASLVVALLGYWALTSAGFVWEKAWMNTVKPALNWSLVFDHLLLVGTYYTGEINPPMWSIVFEVRLSLLFPVIAYLVNRFEGKAVAGAVGTSAAIGMLTYSSVWTTLNAVERDVLMTLHYAAFFVVGSWLYSNRSGLRLWAGNISAGVAMWWAIALALYAYPFDNPWSTGARIFGDIVIGLGAVLLIVLSLRVRDGLVLRTGKWLGKISYSLYLNHALVLNVGLIVLYPRFGAIAVWAWTLPASVVMAVFLHRLVEAPSHSLARRCGKRTAVLA